MRPARWCGIATMTASAEMASFSVKTVRRRFVVGVSDFPLPPFLPRSAATSYYRCGGWGGQKEPLRMCIVSIILCGKLTSDAAVRSECSETWGVR